MPSPRIHRPRPARITGAIAGLLALSLLAACGGDDGADSSSSSPSAPPPPAPDGGGSSPEGGPPEGAADLDAPVQLRDLELGLEAPIAASTVPGTASVLVAEREGRLHEVVFDEDGADRVDGPLLDLTEQVGSTRSERGLLGVAVAPDATHVVVSYTDAEDGSNRIVRYALDGEPGAHSIVPASAVELLSVDQPYDNHNGGHITFGPDDLLYVGIGDGGSGGDPEGNGQDRSTLLGKLLRLDARPGEPLVPADNPFVEAGDGSRPEIWCTGLRNPWRFSFDPATGDLWVADVGQSTWEEIDHLSAAQGAGRGANFGWDLFEGPERFEDADPAGNGWSDGPFVEPVHSYGREEGCSITGGLVHDGSAVPSLTDAYLYADYCAPGLRALVLAGDEVRTADLRGAEADQVVGFAEGPEGRVLVLSLVEGVLELRPA